MIFEPQHGYQSPALRRCYALYEIAYTAVDFSAALSFIVGSIMFFSEDWMVPGTWLFLVGSILFACKPSIRLWREIHLFASGKVDILASRVSKDR